MISTTNFPEVNKLKLSNLKLKEPKYTIKSQNLY